ncbi:MAG: nucleotide exchange factor GrpE [Chloroflexi bacterium]|nr:MAG: nucleotide exchange factor GrpE [Chloroflexota bacterium]
MMNEEVINEEGAAVEETVTAVESEAPHLNGDGIDAGLIDGEVVEDHTTAEAEVVIETAEDVIARLESELAQARAQANDAVDRMQRTAAEFQNTRKRQERLLQESLERATQRLLVALLPVHDDFSLAFQNLPETLTPEEMAWVNGFKRIHDKLAGLLNDEGVKAIEPDGLFDPARHEAVTNEPSAEVESGHIIATLRTGYVLKDRVLRPALVRVAQ